MRTQIVAIGDGFAVIIPKALLRRGGLTDEVDVTAEDNSLMIRVIGRPPRAGWEEAFLAAERDLSPFAWEWE